MKCPDCGAGVLEGMTACDRCGCDFTTDPPFAENAPSMGLVILGYITAVLIPLVGFVLGIVVVTRPDRRVSKHGVRIIGLSLAVFVIGVAVLVSSINSQVQKTQQTLTTIQQHATEAQATIKQEAETREAETRATERKNLESKMAAEKAIYQREPEGSYASDLAKDEYEQDRAQLQQLDVR